MAGVLVSYLEYAQRPSAACALGPLIDAQARMLKCSFVAFRNEPSWVSVFDPIQNASSGEFKRRHIFREQQQAKRQHPKIQDVKKAEQSSAD